MENSIKMDDLAGKPTIFGNTHIYIYNMDHHSPQLLVEKGIVLGGVDLQKIEVIGV